MRHPEGIVRKASGGFVYYYVKKDHIGSTRVSCYDQAGTMKAAQTTDYYPFGLAFSTNGTNYNRYLFSGKELQDQTVNGKKLMLYDFGARNYDPTLGRWFNIDPALQFTNPYTYCDNNPIKYVDPNGMVASPIYNDLDTLIGVDENGLKRDPIFMDEQDFYHGITHQEAVKRNRG